MVAQESNTQPKRTLDLDHQRAVAAELSTFANQVFEGTHTAETEFTRKDYVFFGLADKARVTFDAIVLLCDQSLIDDAFILIRAMVEAVINGTYVQHMGDEAANDYAGFPDFWDWIVFTDLQAVAPEITDQSPRDEIEEMRRKHEAVRDRYAQFRRGDWCQHTLFQRAALVDVAASKDFNLMRVLVNHVWRKASVYVHGTADSIASRVHRTESGVAIKRTFTREEGAGILYMANMTMFMLLALVDMRLGKRHVEKWRELYDRWCGEQETASGVVDSSGGR